MGGNVELAMHQEGSVLTRKKKEKAIAM